MSLDALKKVCQGAVVGVGEPDFAERVYGGLWNRLLRERAPQVVVCAADEQDVIAAIQLRGRINSRLSCAAAATTGVSRR